MELIHKKKDVYGESDYISFVRMIHSDAIGVHALKTLYEWALKEDWKQ